MPAYKITKCIRHRWDDLFHLVLDVQSYPAFVPHCRSVRLLSWEASGSRTTIVSRMNVGFSALQVGYANRTIGNFQTRRIDVEAREGPLRYLRVVWTFSPRADNCTEVELSVNYELNNSLLAAIARGAFRSMSDDIIDAFERRADRLFRKIATPGTVRSMAGQQAITTF